MKISAKLKMIVIILLLFSLTSTVSVFYQLNKMSSDSRVVNYAGIVRGATQRLIKLEMAGSESDELILRLDKIVYGLLEGDSELDLPKASDESFILAMEEVQKNWKELREFINQSRKNGNTTVLLTESEKFYEVSNNAVSVAETFSKGKVVSLKSFQVIILILNLIILAFVWIISTNGISKPLMQLVSTIEKLDVSENIPDSFIAKKDEIGLLSKAFQKVIDNLRELIKQISTLSTNVAGFSQELSQNINQTAAAADEVARAVEEIAKGANEQAQDTEQGVISVNGLGELIEMEQQLIHKLNISANEVNILKNEGLEIIKELVEKNIVNKEATEEIGEIISKTNESANKIENASYMIKNIADQTNLLALNAAIEAARAGDAGRGFAVVAEEIRKLAEQSNGFTEEISKIVEELISKTEYAVGTMQKLGENSASQTESVELTNNKFERIAESIENIKESISVINKSGQEMILKKDEIVGVMENLSAISEENAAGTQEASASVEEQTATMTEIANASESLFTLAAKMRESISKFTSTN